MELDYISIGKKIKDKRIGLLMAVSYVASKLGISEIEYNDIENGIITNNSGDLIVKLSVIFCVDFRFFISDEYKTADGQIVEMFRQNQSLTKSDRISIQKFIQLCEKKFEFEEILRKRKNDVINYDSYPFKSNLHTLQGIESAKIERQRLRITGSIPNILEFLRKQKIHIFRRQLVEKNISGIYIKHPIAGHCILINYLDDIYRQNFSLAHEYCHVLFDSKTEQSITYIKEDSNYVENRANRFASYFLFPEEQISVFKKGWTLNTIKEYIVKYCSHYKINRQVIIFRLNSEGLISNEQCNSLLSDTKLKELTRIKVDSEIESCSENTKEFMHDLIRKGLSIEYLELCRNAYEQGEISFGKFIESLMLDYNDAIKVLKIWNICYGG